MVLTDDERLYWLWRNDVAFENLKQPQFRQPVPEFKHEYFTKEG